VITAREITELREALARATPGLWHVTYTPSKEPRIESTSKSGAVEMGHTVVPASYTMRPEDAQAIVLMQRMVPALLRVLEQSETERVAAVVAMERAENEHMATLRKMLAESAEVKANIERAMGTHNELTVCVNRMERELVSARAQLDHQAPLVAAVETWVRTRHSPRLIAAWDTYSQARAACVKSGS
jgi:hypothetical protein